MRLWQIGLNAHVDAHFIFMHTVCLPLFLEKQPEFNSDDRGEAITGEVIYKGPLKPMLLQAFETGEIRWFPNDMCIVSSIQISN